ncbi:OmpP1/FadL family transporter [Candidatus Latescibacterota bacterium]
MIKRTLLISLICLAGFLFSEPSVFCGSPYSANGIGDIIADDFGRSRGMGGAGIADTDGINLIRDNPALNTTFEQFTFSFGAMYGVTNTNISNGESSDYAKTDPEFLKLVIPITDGIAFGWGLYPYSKTDVKIQVPSVRNGIQLNDTISSIGGINVSSTSLSGSYKDFIHVGLSINYNFGMIQEEWNRTFPNEESMLKSTYFLKRKFKGYSETIGLLANIYKNTTLGLAYTTKTNLEMRSDVVSGDIINPEKNFGVKDVKLPSTIRIGLFSGFSENLKAGMDLKFVQWKDAAVLPKEIEMYNNTYRFGAGVRYIPSTRLNARYYETLPLSAGFRFGTLYYKSYPKIDTVFERAVTLGVELPLTGGTGSIITSFEYGIRGDKDKNGWDESFISVGISLVGKIK